MDWTGASVGSLQSGRFKTPHSQARVGAVSTGCAGGQGAEPVCGERGRPAARSLFPTQALMCRTAHRHVP